MNDPRGSLWRRWDLHFHTPSSFDYENPSIGDNQIVDSLLESGIAAIAITDRHVIDVQRIQNLQAIGNGRLTVFPGIEFRSDQGGQPIHYISIFPEDCDLEHVWTTVQGRLGLTPTAIKEKGGDDAVYVPLEEAAKVTRELGGIVSIHAGAKSNSIEGISNREQFQKRIKYDITRKYVDLMEIGQLRDIDRHLKVIFPDTGLDKPLVLCSDNHDACTYTVKAPLWLRADPTFRGLLMVLKEPRDRVFIGDRPPELVRVQQNPTKYIRNVSFRRKDSAPATERWFNASILFNTGLVSIIGNKGSGKSALSDTLGLLGATKNAAAFSFLSAERFRHPNPCLAEHFEATIEWMSGDVSTRCLADLVNPEELERLKYLPQDHVETVCNELARPGAESFEQELKAVIFSHVPDTERLGQTALDDLVRFRTGEKQKRIDSLLKMLRESGRSRALLEGQADPVVRQKLTEEIKRRNLELEAHEKNKPAEVENPAAREDGVVPDSNLLAEIQAAEAERKRLTDEIANAIEKLGAAQRRHAVANRVLEKLANFQKDFDTFRTSLEEDATELGLRAVELVTLTISNTRPTQIRDQSQNEIAGTNEALDAVDPPGLRQRLASIEPTIGELQTKLDTPNRAYQAYLGALAAWQAKRASIEGTVDDPESLNGLKSRLAALDQIPSKIAKARNEQAEMALQIHSEKLAQATVYRELYGPVQDFINFHPLAKNKLRLEFRAELTNEDFATRFLELLALNRKGSFMGIDEGRAKVEALTQPVDWESPDAVRQLLAAIDTALHVDERSGQGGEVQLKDQLPKGRKPEEVFNLLYGLEYIRPRYVLRWEGKELSMLSPGERGTLLLVFYLLIEKGDMPLIIDQPEGNLDNYTVAKVLVDCIKKAREHRQVFIVTHNPNLAVVSDADQVIYAKMDKENGNAVTYDTGALENPAMSQYVTDVLEGTRWAFGVRDAKYSVTNE
jgi:predicted metal-dependent phosphoesterase TrpH/energy-coupling factor transporter ATP-binding protein EcfA2